MQIVLLNKKQQICFVFCIILVYLHIYCTFLKIKPFLQGIYIPGNYNYNNYPDNSDDTDHSYACLGI